MARPDRILAQELLGYEVLDLAAGEIIGTVVDYALTREGVVTQIGVLPVQWYKGGLGIAPALIGTINRDRICLSDCKDLSSFKVDEVESFSAIFNDEIQGKNVLQQDGELLGVLSDFSFNLDDGRIVDVIVLGPGEKKTRVPVEAFLAIGRDYVVIERSVSTAAADTLSEAAREQKPAPLPAGVSLNGGSKPAAAASSAPPAPVPPAAEAKPEPPVPAEEPAGKPAPAPVEILSPPMAKPLRHATRPEEKAALFGEAMAAAELSKFDQKKRDFLKGRKAHRDLVSQKGETIVARGEMLDDDALSRIIDAGMLGDIFIEMTLNK